VQGVTRILNDLTDIIALISYLSNILFMFATYSVHHFSKQMGKIVKLRYELCYDDVNVRRMKNLNFYLVLSHMENIVVFLLKPK